MYPNKRRWNFDLRSCAFEFAPNSLNQWPFKVTDCRRTQDVVCNKNKVGACASTQRSHEAFDVIKVNEPIIIRILGIFTHEKNIKVKN